MIVNNTVLRQIDSPVRTITAKVELYAGSTLVNTFTEKDRLIKITVERVGEDSKFFGFGISQKANIHLIDTKRELAITTANSFKILFNDVDCLPTFHVTEVHRDENTNELSITAYDALHKSVERTVDELEFALEADGSINYSIGQFASACCRLLEIDGPAFTNISDMSVVNTTYPGGANFEGTENIREALTAVAEATQTVYFLAKNNTLCFKRLDKDGSALLTIDKSKYITLDTGDNRRLAKIYHTTELGDDVFASTVATGSTQYVRDNPFWDMREDVGDIVDNALAAIGGLTIGQFECEWRGNFLLELGDKVAITNKDNSILYSYLLDDVITYDGAYSQTSQWSYSDNELETSDNPTSLGEVLKKTYAKVDKANQQIELVASKSEANTQEIAALRIDVGNISASVESVEKKVEDRAEYVDGELIELTKKVEATMSDEEVRLEISTQLANGVTRVTTTTGYTFNEDGMTVSKSGSDITTTITEDGMSIKRNEEEVLVANNEGVKAEDLHATTYLIIGVNSRFEDYANQTRTGCFWIGKTYVDEEVGS